MDIMESKPTFYAMHSADSFTMFPNDNVLIQNLPVLMNIKKEISDIKLENDNLFNSLELSDYEAYDLVNIKTDPDSIQSVQCDNTEILSKSSLSKIYDAKDLVKLDLNHLSTAITKYESVNIKVETDGLDSTPMTTDLETSLISIKDESFGKLEDFKDASCDENFAESRNTFGHICKTCNKTFVCQENLKRHEQTVHLKVKNAKCSLCNQSFTQIGNLKHHEKTVHLKIREWKCNLCDKYFTKKSNLKRHEETVHLKIREWKCNLCDKYFTKKSNLKRHEETVHLKIRDWKCNLCDKDFSEKGSLKVHKKIVHLKIRDWKCNLCDKDFTFKSHLKVYKKTVHLKIRDCKCDLCDKHFTQKGNLNRHKQVVHLKNWKCNICEKSFAKKVNLDSHSRVHSIDLS